MPKRISVVSTEDGSGEPFDELFRQLAGRARIDALNEMAWELRTSNRRRALALARYAIQLADRGSRPYLSGVAFGHNTLALCHWIEDDFRKALPLAERAYALFKRARDTKGIGSAATVLGLIHWKRDNAEAAWDAWQEAYDRFRQIDYESGTANSLMNLALLLRRDGQLDAARSHYLTALKGMHRENNLMGAANIQNNIGVIDLELGHWAEAATRFRKAFLAQRKLQNFRAASNALCNMAVSSLRRGHCRRAEALLRLHERYYSFGGFTVPAPVAELAWIEYHLHPDCHNADLQEALRRATELKARNTDETTAFKLANLLPDIHERLGQTSDVVATYKELVRLHEQRFTRQGQFRLRKGHVVEASQSVLKETPTPPKTPLNPVSLLTRRQRKIFHLLGKGLLNKEIAHELGISPHTVQAHRRQIAEKLGISGYCLKQLAIGTVQNGNGLPSAPA
jgi:DNA-binding CsgD family transcriptional regulator/Tfp pilus assembly protein PilF